MTQSHGLIHIIHVHVSSHRVPSTLIYRDSQSTNTYRLERMGFARTSSRAFQRRLVASLRSPRSRTLRHCSSPWWCGTGGGVWTKLERLTSIEWYPPEVLPVWSVFSVLYVHPRKQPVTWTHDQELTIDLWTSDVLSDLKIFTHITARYHSLRDNMRPRG